MHLPFATPGWDLAAQTLINQGMRCDLLNMLMPVASSKPLLAGIGVLVFLWLFIRFGWKKALPMLMILASIGVADLSCNVLKKHFGRVRPKNAVASTYYQDDGTWQQRPADFVQTDTRGKSYVSAHGANSMAIAVSAMLLWPGLRPWLLLLPLITGFSRVYLGKHYPSDVMAGWLVGFIAATLVALAWTYIQRRLKAYGAHEHG